MEGIIGLAFPQGDLFLHQVSQTKLGTLDRTKIGWQRYDYEFRLKFSSMVGNIGRCI
jgi:hypothetical protein